METTNVNWTIKELDETVEALAKCRATLDEIRDQEKKQLEIKKQLEGLLLKMIEQSGTKGYVSTYGRISIVDNLSYKQPATVEDKKSLLSYIENKGDDIYYSLVGVNSQTLNAWCKKEVEAANQSGIFPFEVPGVGDPISYRTIRFTKGSSSNAQGEPSDEEG